METFAAAVVFWRSPIGLALVEFLRKLNNLTTESAWEDTRATSAVMPDLTTAAAPVAASATFVVAICAELATDFAPVEAAETKTSLELDNVALVASPT